VLTVSQPATADSSLAVAGQATAEQLAALALSLAPGLGPRLLSLLLEHYGDCQTILQQSATSLRQISGIGPQIASALTNPTLPQQAAKLWSDCQNSSVRLYFPNSSQYPPRLHEICDRPQVLYARGTLLPTDALAIAVVGSRRCSVYGIRQAERFSAQLARAGFTVVSGLARGIDTAAHRAALQAGGRTLAVLPGGVDTIYPPENQSLAGEITQQGALISEMPLNQQILPGLFPQRNRIISGMSLGVLLVEASARSGALYTARHAHEQGREVFAVPGPIDSLASAGCHQLIRDGAVLVRHVDDILEALGPLPSPVNITPDTAVHSPRELTLNAIESRVLSHISPQPTPVDELLRLLPAESSQVLATLTVLEVRRLIRRLPGNFVVRYS
jgi:DNA processing protein